MCNFCDNVSNGGFLGVWFCRDCYRRMVRVCEYCGEDYFGACSCVLEHTCYSCGEYGTIDTDRGIRCERCAEDFRRCIDCGDLVHRSEGHGDFICNDCVGNTYDYCDCCEVVCETSAILECGGEHLCSDCFPQNRYETRPWGRNVDPTTFEELPNVFFGIEIETREADYGKVPDNWGIHYDGSINGMEIVSPVLCGDSGLQAIRQVYAECKPEFDECCGIHVHVDASKLNKVQLMDLIKAFTYTKEHWFNFVASDRRDNEYCTDALPELRWDDDFNSYARRADSRYTWLNLQAFSKHGTFELRLLEGCKLEKVEKWLKMLLNFVAEVRNMADV